MILRIENLNEINDVVKNAASLLTQIIGEPVELRITKPDIEGLNTPRTVDELQRRIEEDLKMGMIINIVCEQLMVSPNDLRGNIRKKLFVDGRKIAAHLIFSNIGGVNTKRVGAALGSDHSCAIYWKNQAENHILTDKEFRFHYEKCRNAFLEGIKQKEVAA